MSLRKNSYYYSLDGYKVALILLSSDSQLGKRIFSFCWLNKINQLENTGGVATTKKEFFIVWCVLSGVIIAVIVTPYVVPASWIGSFIPQCAAKIKGSSCSLCGMTTAFYHIATGAYEKARQANSHSIVLYVTFLINEIIIAMFILHKILRRVYLCRY